MFATNVRTPFFQCRNACRFSVPIRYCSGLICCRPTGPGLTRTDWYSSLPASAATKGAIETAAKDWAGARPGRNYVNAVAPSDIETNMSKFTGLELAAALHSRVRRSTDFGFHLSFGGALKFNKTALTVHRSFPTTGLAPHLAQLAKVANLPDRGAQ